MNESASKLPKLAWLMIVGSGLSRGAFFMAFPFLAIHLKNSLGVDISTIGWIIGVGPLMGAVVGFYGAYLSDVFGRRKILTISLIVWGLVQGSFSIANSVLFFGVLSALNGILRAIAEPIIQATISDCTDGETKTRAYHYRYFAINVGAAVGPILGSWMLLKDPTLGFALAGCSLVIFAVSFFIFSDSLQKTTGSSVSPPKFLLVMKTLAKDGPLKCFVFASILCSIAYAQTDSTLPIILNDVFGEEGIKVFGWVISANAMTIVAFQLLLNKWTKHLDVAKTVASSCVVFGLGFLGFGLSGSIWWAYIASMVVLALGEILVFSNGFILIDRLAPDNLRGTYHSAANLFAIGLALGPPIGAWILQRTDQFILFSFSAVLLLASGGLYLLGDKIGSKLKPL